MLFQGDEYRMSLKVKWSCEDLVGVGDVSRWVVCKALAVKALLWPFISWMGKGSQF